MLHPTNFNVPSQKNNNVYKNLNINIPELLEKFSIKE